jgi:hypothetical protein
LRSASHCCTSLRTATSYARPSSSIRHRV